MVNSFPRVKLNDVAHIVMGQSPKGSTYNKVGDGIPLINGPTEFGSSHPMAALWTTAPTKICSKGDILFCVRGSTTGRMNWADREYCIGRGIGAFRAKMDSTDTRFLWYNLIYELPRLLSLCAGSVFPNLARQDFETFSLNWPDKTIRSAISSILGALDDKIELNRKMNETLEAMARAIFKSWFVDFDPIPGLGPHKEWQDSQVGKIPKEWGISTLAEMCEVVMGQSPPGETYNEIEEGLPFYQGIREFGFRAPSKRVYCTAPTRFAEEGDVLLSVRAPVGSLNIASESCAIGRGVAALRIKGQHYGFLYYLMKETQWEWAKFEAVGTVFGAASKTDVQNFSAIFPPSQIISRFNEVVFPFDQKIMNNETQSLTVATIRDTLLPKLLSGEIRVKDAAKLVDVA